MTGKILVIKTGSTLPDLCDEKGDFEDWVLAGLGIGRDQALVVDVCKGEPLPAWDAVAGTVITGSHSMVTGRLDWSERTAAWLAQAVQHGAPVLGICYGHQLLAHALGGRVGYNPNGHEYGTKPARLAASAATDRLLGGLDEPVRVHVCHAQSVLALPPGATLLASSDMDLHLAFAAGEMAWGVQFHPEFDAGIVRAYIDHVRDILARENQDPDRLIEQVADTPYGQTILRRFAQLVFEREEAA